MTETENAARRAARHPLSDPPAISREDAVARIAAIIRRDRAERAAKQAAEKAQKHAEATDDSTAPFDVPIEGEDDSPAPPPSWSRDDLTLFFSLPPEVQAVIARRERERDIGVRRRLDAIAKETKAVETERERALQLLADLEKRLAALPPKEQAADSDPLEAKPEDTWRAQMRETMALQKETLAKVTRQRELTALLHAIPEWNTPAHRETEAQALNRFLTQAGFKDDELGELSDHRQIVVARKAMLYDQLMRSKPLAEKKLAAAPTMLSPGAARPKKSEEERRRAALIKRYRQTGRHEDAVAVISDYLKD